MYKMAMWSRGAHDCIRSQLWWQHWTWTDIFTQSQTNAFIQLFCCTKEELMFWCFQNHLVLIWRYIYTLLLFWHVENNHNKDSDSRRSSLFRISVSLVCAWVHMSRNANADAVRSSAGLSTDAVPSSPWRPKQAVIMSSSSECIRSELAAHLFTQ